MRLIPAIDIIDGKCVRLTKGDYSQQTTYSDNPVDMAKRFQDHGLQYLHLVDLDGARSQHVVNHKVLEQICTQTDLQVDFGGGVKTDEDIRIVFESGAQQVTGGSIAVKNPDIFQGWLERYGAEKIILGADCRHRKVATTGWTETSELDVVDFISRFPASSAGRRDRLYVICTDIAKDGMLQGPSLDLYRDILDKTDVKLIASGGVTSLDDIDQLQEIGCDGAIIGKAIYEGKISLKQLRNFVS